MRRSSPTPISRKRAVEDLLSNIDALPEAIRAPVRNNGGGHANHTMFWEIMAPGGAREPSGPLADAITKAFGGLAQFKEQFAKACVGRFGSGWGWLIADKSGEPHHRQHAQPGLAAHAAERRRSSGATSGSMHTI